jgi:hypothetical protein
MRKAKDGTHFPAVLCQPEANAVRLPVINAFSWDMRR